jgi:hypothetical protein
MLSHILGSRTKHFAEGVAHACKCSMRHYGLGQFLTHRNIYELGQIILSSQFDHKMSIPVRYSLPELGLLAC